MKWNCELILDLLPLYEEGLCSPASAAAVSEHLHECEKCRRLTGALPIAEPEAASDTDRAVTRSIKRVKRRWLSSLVAAVLLVPVLLLSMNQVRGTGICFTNVDDILTARAFLTALERRDWDTAARLHDYSGDYESILEALSLSEESWGPTFDRVRIHGEDYVLKSHIAAGSGTPETAADLYSFLYNHRGNAMVSPALWDRVQAIDPGAFIDLGEGTVELNGEWYSPADTPWGEYVTTSGHSFATAAEYCHYFDLLPAAAYDEARAELEAESRRLYERTHAHYGYVAQMTEAEFLAHMERSYAGDLRSLEDAVSFDCTGFRGAYRLWENDGWHVQFGVTLTYRGKSLDTTMAFGVQDGRVHVVSLSHREQADWLDELEKALYPSAHPAY